MMKDESEQHERFLRIAQNQVDAAAGGMSRRNIGSTYDFQGDFDNNTVALCGWRSL